MMGLVTTKMQTLEIVLRVIVGIIMGVGAICLIYDDWKEFNEEWHTIFGAMWMILKNLMLIFAFWFAANFVPSAIALFIEMYVIK
jgi:hypothetical protein